MVGDICYSLHDHSSSARNSLLRWRQDKATASSDDMSNILDGPGGFGSLSRRRSSKPIIAAVNGHALGGGSEIVVNSDIVVASMKAKFGFPEVHVGVVAASGGIQRLLRIAGHQVLFLVPTLDIQDDNSNATESIGSAPDWAKYLSRRSSRCFPLVRYLLHCGEFVRLKSL